MAESLEPLFDSIIIRPPTYPPPLRPPSFFLRKRFPFSPFLVYFLRNNGSSRGIFGGIGSKITTTLSKYNFLEAPMVGSVKSELGIDKVWWVGRKGLKVEIIRLNVTILLSNSLISPLDPRKRYLTLDYLLAYLTIVQFSNRVVNRPLSCLFGFPVLNSFVWSNISSFHPHFFMSMRSSFLSTTPS